MFVLHNCTQCGKLILEEKAILSLCTDCYKEEVSIFNQLKDVIKAQPGITIAELSQQTGIPVSKIILWIREDRIQLSHS